MHGDDHGSWHSKWPANLTAGGARTAIQPEVDTRRDMFSPFGRGRTITSAQDESSSRPRRSTSAPPRIARSLKDTLVTRDKRGGDPYATPVIGVKSQADESTDRLYGGSSAVGDRSMVSDAPLPNNNSSNGGTRDISAAVAKWSSRSLAELMTSKTISNGDNKVKISEVNNVLTPAGAPPSTAIN